MDLNSKLTSPVLADTAPVSTSRLGIKSLVPYSPAGTTFSPALFLTLPRKKSGKLDDLRTSNTWLDAMKSSSPTHNKRNKDSSADQTSTENDVVYKNWMVILPVPCQCSSIIISFLICKFAR